MKLNSDSSRSGLKRGCDGWFATRTEVIGLSGLRVREGRRTRGASSERREGASLRGISSLVVACDDLLDSVLFLLISILFIKNCIHIKTNPKLY